MKLGVPVWSVVAFAAGIGLALSPNLFYLYGIHNDYEMALQAEQHHLFFTEAGDLAAIGRPVAALLSNIPMLPVGEFADFRWTRLFSLLTVCVLGAQMISISVRTLQVRTLDAVAVALATFLVPSFIYATLNATAWAPYLVAVFISFAAYAMLSRSDVEALPFLALARDRDYRGMARQVRAYAALRAVLVATLILQLALYDYPPDGLAIAIFPAIGLLFSQAPQPWRTLRALRDLAFVVANLAIYGVTARLIYIPIVSLFVARGGDPGAFDQRVSVSYRYALNTDLGAMLSRLWTLLKVSGDLWFLPQAGVHVVVAIAILVVLLLAAVTRARQGALAAAVTAACFLLAASAVLLSSGGFITYRTIPVCTALAAIVAVWLVRRAGEAVGRRVADVAVALIACVAVAANFYLNDLTMRLARNETAYFADIVRRAAAAGKKTLVIIDPRPISLPEDNPVLYDARGRWIPPYELGCLSGPCLQNGAIARVLAQRLGYPDDSFRVFPFRGDEEVPGLTCEMLSRPTLAYPRGASDKAIGTVRFLRTFAPLECVTYSLDWRDLSLDLEHRR